ncbi:MAG TPA: class I SAM-dependent methyltransferase [Tepidisphaeraceae bacterium]|nr:class I SAM-dependent methyltransferase [Tepidisphaeraceae bacterium]
MKRYRAIADYYDAENDRLAWLQHDVPFFLRQLPKRAQDVLELATGTARAAIPIAQAGHRVVGVDYAQEMLEIARRKRDAVGLRDRELSLVHADVLELDLHRKFDWVTIFFNTFLSFTTLRQQDAVLQVARRHLKPHGRQGGLWLDIFQPNLALMASDESRGIDPAIFYVPHLNRAVFMSVDVKRDPSKQLQQITFNYRWFDDRGRERKQKTRFDLTFIFPRELQILLERNGFRIEKMFGDHDGGELNADSARIIARCRLA